jgi:hypothetical protein
MKNHDENELAALKEEFNALMGKSMTVGERFSNEGQAKIDRICDLRDILNLWNFEDRA